MHMSDDRAAQTRHYDLLAAVEDITATPWEFDETSLRYSLQTPYTFCKNWFSSNKTSGKSILDFGCGARALSIYLLTDKSASITGVDLSSRSISIAEKKSKHHGVHKSASFEVGDCESLKYDDGSFDFIFSAGTLSCLDIDRAFREMARVLKTDGSVVIVDTLGHNPLLNANRYLKVKLGKKRQSTANSILRETDYRLAHKYFKQIETRHFGLLTPLCVPLSVVLRRQLKPFVKFVERVDRLLLSIPQVKKHAFKVVCVLSCPRDGRQTS